MFSERDIIRRVLGNHLKPDTDTISDAMTPNPNTTPPDVDTLTATLATIEKGYRHIIITDANGNLVSVLSNSTC